VAEFSLLSGEVGVGPTSISMLSSTPHGAETQYRLMLANAGLKDVAFKPLNALPQTLVIAGK
jgi:hypothetical protein